MKGIRIKKPEDLLSFLSDINIVDNKTVDIIHFLQDIEDDKGNCYYLLEVYAYHGWKIEYQNNCLFLDLESRAKYLKKLSN